MGLLSKPRFLLGVTPSGRIESCRLTEENRNKEQTGFSGHGKRGNAAEAAKGNVSNISCTQEIVITTNRYEVQQGGRRTVQSHL